MGFVLLDPFGLPNHFASVHYCLLVHLIGSHTEKIKVDYCGSINCCFSILVIFVISLRLLIVHGEGLFARLAMETDLLKARLRIAVVMETRVIQIFDGRVNAQEAMHSVEFLRFLLGGHVYCNIFRRDNQNSYNCGT